MRQAEHGVQAMASSWLGAVTRAVSPVRLVLCFLGLVVSLSIGAVALAAFTGTPVGLAAWWEDPLGKLQLLGRELVGQGSGRAIVRCFLLTNALWITWCLPAGWIARAELLWQRASGEPPQTTATRFVVRKAPTLSRLLLMPWVVLGLALFPGLVAGAVSWVPPWGIGAFLAALALPVVLLASLMFTLTLVGGLSCFLMPSAVAAEGADGFDALSRGYSYFFQRPLWFAWWWGLSLAVSSLPLAALWLTTERPTC
jgi:hypothetical protein